MNDFFPKLISRLTPFFNCEDNAFKAVGERTPKHGQPNTTTLNPSIDVVAVSHV